MKLYSSRDFLYMNNDGRSKAFCEVQVFRFGGSVTLVVADPLLENGDYACDCCTSAINAIRAIARGVQNVLSKPQVPIDRVVHYMGSRKQEPEEFSMFSDATPYSREWEFFSRDDLQLMIGEWYVSDVYQLGYQDKLYTL